MVKDKQNEDVYKDITRTGKSLLQLYVEVKEERDKLLTEKAANRILNGV